MVGIHLAQFIDAGLTLQGTVGAVAHALCLGSLGLLGIDAVDGSLVKHADVQQALVLLAAQDVFKHALVVGHIGVGIQFMHALGNSIHVVRILVVFLIEASPLQAAHLGQNILEHARSPIDNCVEIGLDWSDISILAVLAHIAIHIVLAYPLQGTFKVVLAVGRPFDVGTPLLDIGILRVAEFFLQGGHKRARIDGIQFFLIVQVHAGNVDGLKPVLDFALGALADVDEQTGVEHLVTVFLV